MKKKLLILSFVIDFIILAYLGVSYYFASQIVAFETRTFDEIRVIEQDRNQEVLAYIDSIDPEEVEFLTDDGLTLLGWFIPAVPDEVKVPGASFIVLHGKDNNRMGVLDAAYILINMGINVLVYDSRYHGESDGDYATYGYYEKNDVLSAISYLLTRSDVNPDYIGVYGESFGAAVSIQAAGIDSDNKIKVIIADSSFLNLTSIVVDYGEDMYPWLPEYPFIRTALWMAGLLADFDVEDASPEKYSTNINCPALILHCKADENINYQYSETIYENIPNGQKEIYLFDDCPHTLAINLFSEEYKTVVSDFLNKNFF